MVKASLVIVTIVLITCVIYILTNETYKLLYSVKIKSRVDNKYYTVRNVSPEYSINAADTLATLNKNVGILLDYLKANDDSFSTRLLIDRYNPDKLSENILQIDTTFTIDKGPIEFCLDSRDPTQNTNEIHDINTLTYVIIHELAHLASVTYNHTPEFKRNFAFLVKKSIECGIYKYQDYSKQSVDYCGISIKHSII